jgi:DNA-binding response OmpR family regulator
VDFSGFSSPYSIPYLNKMGLTENKMASILVIDDQPFIGEMLSGDLAGDGHTVNWVEEADYAICAIQEYNPDLILLDLYLKGFEGWDLLKQIRRYAPEVPVLILSAYDSFIGDPRLEEANGYVIKNSNTDLLKQKINENLLCRGSV